jgi:hypothetical protein
MRINADEKSTIRLCSFIDKFSSPFSRAFARVSRAKNDLNSESGEHERRSSGLKNGRF